MESHGAVDALRIGRAVRWLAASLILIFGLITFDRESSFWSVLSLALFSLPLAVQATPWPMARVYALWFGIFLVLQSIATPLVRNEYLTLPPNLRATVDVRTDHAPGFRAGIRKITTDAKGFRVAPPVDYDKKRGTRIFAIGGSTTEDILLDDRATWTHVLQEGLRAAGRDVEIINTGVSGLRARNHVATLKAIAEYEPDLVLLMVGANDWNKQIRDEFEPSRDSYRLPELRKSLFGKTLGRLVVTPLRVRLIGGSGLDSSVVIDKPDGFNSDMPRDSLNRTRKRVFNPADVSPGYREDIGAFVSTCREKGLRCVLLTQPSAYSEEAPEELRRLFWMTPPYADYTLDLAAMQRIASMYNGLLESLAREHGLPVCDVAAPMPPSISLFYDDMHFTDDGARRVAEIVQPCIEEALGR
jgi:lysophospholipase L1-like esterase